MHQLHLLDAGVERSSLIDSCNEDFTEEIQAMDLEEEAS